MFGNHLATAFRNSTSHVSFFWTHRVRDNIPALLRLCTEALMGLVTIGGFFLLFYPRPTIAKLPQGQPSGLLNASFAVANNTMIALENVQIAIGWCHLTLVLPSGKPMVLTEEYCHTGVLQPDGRWKHPTLGSDEREEISLTDLFAPLPTRRITDGEITIAVFYRPWFLPVLKEKKFRFMTRRNAAGHLSWTPVPLN